MITDAAIKTRIRTAAEVEERAFYEERATPEWLAALEPLGTDSNKPFLEAAPALIAIFAEAFGENSEGAKVKHYYATESVGIATGLLVAAIHHASGRSCCWSSATPLTMRRCRISPGSHSTASAARGSPPLSGDSDRWPPALRDAECDDGRTTAQTRSSTPDTPLTLAQCAQQ